MLKRTILFLFFLSISAASADARSFEQFLEQAENTPVGERQALVDEFMSGVTSTPLIEAETRVHFLYRGEAV